MSEAAPRSRARARLRFGVVIGISFVWAALGVVSLQRQSASSSVAIGFSVLDGSGTIAVQPGGASDRAGLRTGDRLRSLAGSPFDGALTWNTKLLEGAGRLSGTVPVEVARGSETFRYDVPLRIASGVDPTHRYLALVGFFFLATATVAALGTSRSPLTGKYYAFSCAIFAVLALSDTPAGAGMDWVLFYADRLGRLGFGPLFFLLVAALARRSAVRSWWSPLAWAPPILLGGAGLAIQGGAASGVLRDPLALWHLKDRLELLMAAGFVLAGIGLLWAGVRRESALNRRYLLRWALWGSVVGFAPLIVFELLPVGLGAEPPPWAELSALSLVVLPLTFSTVLFRFRQGDLELYLKRAVGFLSVLFLTLAVFAGVSLMIDRLGGAGIGSEWVRTGVAFVVAVALYPKIRVFTLQTIDRLVYGGRYSFRRTLLSFARELNSVLDLETLVTKFQERTRQTLDLASSVLLVRFDREGVLRPVRETAPRVSLDSPLVHRIKGLSFLLLDELAHAPGADKLEGLRQMGVQYLFPMKVEGEVRAVLATGGRRGGDPLNREDVELLVALCGHAAIALERARLFAALQGKVEEIERLRRYNEDILESSRVGILVVDEEGVVQALNQALVDIYGAPRENVLGKTLADVFPLPLVRRLARQEGAADEADGIRRLYRYSLTDRKGSRIVVNISISRLAAAGGEAGGGRVIVFDDVTDQVRMEGQLLRQDRLASIGLLASGVAHEVNTPLTGISSYTQMLLAEIDPDDPRVEVLRKIERQTFRAANIVHSLLNFTRDGSGGAESIRVRDLLDESLALFEPQLRGGQIQVAMHVEEGLPPLPGNRGKLQQVLLNLLLNARDAIPGRGTIRLSAYRKGGRLALEVADDGEGIAEEDLGKIFDPFFTTKPHGRGTGLGLSLSYTIVQEHRGEILVESRRGQGSVFVVDLPLESRDAAHA